MERGSAVKTLEASCACGDSIEVSGRDESSRSAIAEWKRKHQVHDGVTEPLPFRCPFCNLRLGFGSSAVLFSIAGGAVSIDVKREALPCCGTVVTGSIDRDEHDHYTMNVVEVVDG